MVVIDLLFILLFLVVIVDGAGKKTGERQSLRGYSGSHVVLLLEGVALEELTNAQRNDRSSGDYAWSRKERFRFRFELLLNWTVSI